jgi:HD domain-containing protein/GAF domain-containing protein
MKTQGYIFQPGEFTIGILADLYVLTQDLVSIQDEDFLLEKILTNTRGFLHAEAGTIFQVKDGKLHFTYVQNDKMFEGSTDLRLDYTMRPIEINQSSLAGYTAATGEVLNIADAYQLPAEAPYSFNKSYDQSSGYRTRSILMAPLSAGDKVIGVLQVINALGEHGEVVPFSDHEEMLGGFFANMAAFALERAMMTRELILRTMRMAELRDPKETGAHVNRVGSYSADIYAAWAKSQGLSPEEIEKQRDLIRVAAMLHDVGKVAISDTILKKPGRFTDDEFAIMKQHTVMGARLFKESTTDLDQLAADIALNHHERYDAKGYPGHIEDIHAEEVEMGPGKKSGNLSIATRVCALADVYDALISTRVYKDAWTEDKVLALIREERGKQFDPQVVDAFFATYASINATRRRFSE